MGLCMTFYTPDVNIMVVAEDAPFGPPPHRIRTCRTTSYGSYLV